MAENNANAEGNAQEGGNTQGGDDGQNTNANKGSDFIAKKTYDSDIQRLSGLVTNVNEENNDLKNKLSGFGKYTPDSIKELEQQVNDLKASSVGSNSDELNRLVDEKVAEIRQNLGDEITSKDDTIASLTAELKDIKVTQAFLTEHGSNINDDMKSLISGIVQKNVDIDENGNRYIKGDDGKVRYSKSNPANPMTEKEFVDELMQTYPSAFKPVGINQGGMQAGQRQSASSNNNLSVDIGGTVVDLHQFFTDKNYKESLSPVQMAGALRKARELNLDIKGL